MSFMTAAIPCINHSSSLFSQWLAGFRKDIPVLVYRGFSVVVVFALQLAKVNNLNSIITIADSSIDIVD